MRARLQRLNDAKFFSAWVTDFDDQEIRVRINGTTEVVPNDLFLVEVYGRNSIATFQGLVTVTYDNQAHLNILTPIKTRPENENPRVAINTIYGTITHDEIETDVRVVDISLGGMGIIVRDAIGKGEQIAYKFSTPVGEIRGEGQIRYCRLDAAGNGAYRIGVRLAEQGRIEQARWNRLLEKDAA